MTAIEKFKLIELYFKLHKRLVANGKFQNLSNKVEESLEKSWFFNNYKVICLYNHDSSIPIVRLLADMNNYFKNSFVFPRLEDNKVHLYHVSGPEDLVIDSFGIIDVVPDLFKVDIDEVDIILVSGMAFDFDLNVLNIGDNEELYSNFLNKSKASKYGVCLDCQIYRKGLPESNYKVDALLNEEGVQIPIGIGDI